MSSDNKKPKRRPQPKVEKQHICFYGSKDDDEDKYFVDLSWNQKDVEAFRTMWEEGLSVEWIAAEFRRPPIEVGLLVMDQAHSEKIKKRGTGIFGIGDGKV